jgi:hypothetical protein
MVGVGWLVIMDDWLLRGGALGALLGFVIGGALLLPIGWVYGKLVIAMPDAAGEVAYTSAVFSRPVSFATGWMMTLAYFIVCPWEAVAVGRIAGYIVPASIRWSSTALPAAQFICRTLSLVSALTALLTVLNYRGIRLSATFQNWTSFGTLALFVIFVSTGREPRVSGQYSAAVHTHAVGLDSAGDSDRALFHDRLRIGRQSRGRSQPGLPHARLLPRYLDGDLRRHSFLRQHRGGGRIVAPWRRLTGEKFMTAVAFQQAVGSSLDRDIILAAALLSSLQMLQRKFRRGQPLALCPGTPRNR